MQINKGVIISHIITTIYYDIIITATLTLMAITTHQYITQITNTTISSNNILNSAKNTSSCHQKKRKHIQI